MTELGVASISASPSICRVETQGEQSYENVS